MAERRLDHPRPHGPAPRDDPEARARVGLCLSCRHVLPVRTNRGSTFYRCGLAETDPSFVRYPPLPVLRCSGHSAS
jgi:hypothetical protein